MLAGLPSTIIGTWTGMAFADNVLLFYVATALANWTSICAWPREYFG